MFAVIEYTNPGYQQGVTYGTYPQISQPSTMPSSYPNYSIPSSLSGTSSYTNQVSSYATTQQPANTSYSYSTGQNAPAYGVPPNPPVVSYSGFQPPAGATAAPPPPVVGTDGGPYGVRPPPPPPMQQNAGEVFHVYVCVFAIIIESLKSKWLSCIN